MTDHTDLIRRLEEAEAGGRALDADVFAALGFTYDHGPADVWRDAGGDPFYFNPITSSFDAALALAERVLPGWGFFLRSDKDGCNCGLVYPDAHFVTPGCGTAATPALALVAATLRALQSKEEG